MRRTPLLALMSLALLASCRFDGGNAEDAQRTIEVRGAHVAFTAVVPDDWGISWLEDAAACDSVIYDVEDDATVDVRFQAVPWVCEEAANSDEIGNGFHGLYRTLADVPDPKDVEKRDTDLGSAEVFTQEYYECTNSCEKWDEPVAIVTLDDPVDPYYPTLVVRVERNDISRSDFETIIDSLAVPYTGSS